MRGNRRVKLGDAFGKYSAKVTIEDFQQIREDYFERGKKMKELTRNYPYARSTIERIFGRGRGYVGVKDKGIVSTVETAGFLSNSVQQAHSDG